MRRKCAITLGAKPASFFSRVIGSSARSMISFLVVGDHRRVTVKLTFRLVFAWKWATKSGEVSRLPVGGAKEVC